MQYSKFEFPLNLRYQHVLGGEMRCISNKNTYVDNVSYGEYHI